MIYIVKHLKLSWSFPRVYFPRPPTRSSLNSLNLVLGGNVGIIYSSVELYNGVSNLSCSISLSFIGFHLKHNPILFVRELLEESGLTVDILHKIGNIKFEFIGETELLDVHIFRADSYIGVPTESDGKTTRHNFLIQFV